MMKTYRTGAVAMALAGLAVFGVVWTSLAVGQQRAGGEEVADPQTALHGAVDGRRSFSFVNVLDQGNNRFIFMTKAPGTATEGAHTILSDQEMDLHQMVIANGTPAINRATSFGILHFPSGGLPIFAASSGEFGTTTIDFSIPLEIREGDNLEYSYFPLPGEPSQGFVQMTLIGTVPSAGVDSLSVH